MAKKRRMTRTIRLSRDGQSFDPTAHFKVLSAMLAPNDGAARAHILDSVRRDNGDPTRRRGALIPNDSRFVQARGSRCGSAAGFIYGSLIQLHFKHGVQRPTIHMALGLYRDQLEDHPKDDRLTITGNQTAGIDYAATADFHPRSNEALYGIYKEFGSVAHFWAVVLFIKQEWEFRRASGLPAHEKGLKATVQSGLGPVALPIKISLLPEFLGYATAIRNLYEAIPKVGKSGALLSIEEPWDFTAPQHLAETPKIDVLPIPDRELERISQMLTEKPI